VIFYNYTIGFELAHIDLLKTTKNLLKTGLAKAVFFSDFKYIYTDKKKEIKINWIQPQGRQWDSSWKIQFDAEVPTSIATELTQAIQAAFQEQRIIGSGSSQIAPYIIASLPPIVLELDEVSLSLFASVKLFEDGIAILSFQYDATWEGIDEKDFISNIVNLYQRYFRSIWVDSRIQRYDAEELLPFAFQEELSIAGNSILNWKTKRLLRKMRKESRQTLNKALDQQGQNFNIGNEEWILHEIAGSKEMDSWESTMDLCRSEYTNTLCRLVVSGRNKKIPKKQLDYVWEGRPSVTLMRYLDQPSTKIDLLSRFDSSLSRILMRSPSVNIPLDLPQDLRPFGDYCFHGNRAMLLYTWLKLPEAPADAWNDTETSSALMENQARAEHAEYLNMRIVRACRWAQFPPSVSHLREAYATLAFTEDMIHRSSQSGEVSEALAYLMEKFGTLKLVSSAKETARWHLDELGYESDRSRNRMNRWIAFVFGLVGTAGLADFAIQPNLEAICPDLKHEAVPIVAFGIATVAVLLITLVIWGVNKIKTDN
jgi:hypothetical protein